MTQTVNKLDYLMRVNQRNINLIKNQTISIPDEEYGELWPFFCKLTLRNGNIIELEGSGALTYAMISSYKSTLVSAEIGTKCTSIGNTAFRNYSRLSSIDIPDSVTSIGSNAFSGCSSLTSIVIPSGVTSISYGTFYNCKNLTSITIPDSVTNIGGNAFGGCSSLTSCIIGSSVTSIGDSAFYGCTGLTSIVVNSGNTVYDSRNNCNAIIETETNTLVKGCNTTIIPNSVTSIGMGAFSRCTGLTSIVIPDSVISIDIGAFRECTSLTSITVDNNNTIFDSRNNCNAIIETETNTLVKGCNTTIIPDSVTSIGDEAFSDCSLTGITIPDSVISIGSNAFSGCSSLVSIVIPDSVTSIGGHAFWECTGLTSIEIPNSVTRIGNYAFDGCGGLTSCIIGSGVTSIGELTFSSCNSLTSITSLAITAPTIDSNTFYNVKTCGTLTVPNGSTGYDVWMGTGNYYLGKYNWTKVEQ